jgi:hypothetical protein
MILKRACVALAMIAALATAANAEWTRFRGENGAGIGPADAKPPVEWSDTENIVWKVDLPGGGASTPMIRGDMMYLTAYSGYGEDTGSPAGVVYHVLQMDPADGSFNWHKKIKAPREVQQWESWTVSHGFASASAAVAEDAVYVSFGNAGVFALDHEGNSLWHQDVGRGTHRWGTGASPIVYKDLVIVNASVESERLLGLDRKTGEVRWQQDGVKDSWATPVVMTVDGRDELVLSHKGQIRAFDPTTGKQLWHVRGSREYVVPSPVAHDGVVYCLGRRSAWAIKGGGSGNVEDTHLLWRSRGGATTPSPVYHDGHLYWMDDTGAIYCVNAANGEMMFRERVRPRPDSVYCSITAVGGHLYTLSRGGTAYVFEADPEYNLVTVNELEAGTEADESAFNASPVPLGDRLLLRSDNALYCIGQ